MKNEREEVLQGAEIPVQPVEKTIMMQAIPLQLVEDPTPEQVDVP